MRIALSRGVQVSGWGLMVLALLIAGAAVPAGEDAFFAQVFLLALPIAMLGAGTLFVGRRIAFAGGFWPGSQRGRPERSGGKWRVRTLAALASAALLLAIVLAVHGAIEASVSDDAQAWEGFSLLIYVVVSPLAVLSAILGLLAFVQSRSGVPTKLSVSRSKLALAGGGALLGGAMAVLYDAQALAFLLLVSAIGCGVLVWADLQSADTSR